MKNIDKAMDEALRLCQESGAELLFLTIFGSALYGTATPGKSDLDLRGIFLPSPESLALGEAPRSLHFSSGVEGDKNSADDMDIDLWSIQHWLFKLLPAGDTGAMDVLFAPSNPACTLVLDERIKDVFAHPELLMDAGNCRAYADYSLGQAKKYGIKGSRLGALRAVRKWITDNDSLDPKDRLESILLRLADECGDGKYCTLLDTEQGTALRLCGKIHVGGIRIGEFVQRVENDMEKYGARAIEAEKNQGLDFKALSHALRAFDQMEELYKTGRIVFPLATRKRLMQVKRGEIPWVDLEPIILERLAEIDAIRESCGSRMTYDTEFARKQVLACYRGKTVN